jgi:transcriptional regulator with XRE-family HTH domain
MQMPESETRTVAPMFAILLRTLREHKGITQRELGEYLGVAESTIAKIESGARKAPQDKQFYEKLKTFPKFAATEVDELLRARLPDIPGLTDEEIAQRMNTGDDGPASPNATFSGLKLIGPINTAAGSHMFMLFDPGPLPYDDIEIQSLNDYFKEEVKTGFTQWLRRIESRNRSLNRVEDSRTEKRRVSNFARKPYSRERQT